ncbi:MAG: M2 family metallopeptidase [Elusimicrobiota bacterium]|nr:M2 family metallopeptidase [Elusimicrobiota bacterium]
MNTPLLLVLLAVAAHAAPPTVDHARDFILKSEATLDELSATSDRAAWVYANFITYDSEKLSADAGRAYSAEAAKLAKESRYFERLDLPPDLARKFLLLKLQVSAPMPADPKEQKELAELGVGLDAAYSKWKHCPKPDKCMTFEEIDDRFRLSRDPQELAELWAGWHAVGVPMRAKYARFVELSNKGSRDLGFKDTAHLWRAGYDMTPEQFEAELDRLWLQLKPLYDSLHAYVGRKLNEKYGPGTVGEDGLIPAHLMGNMWAQTWDNTYDFVAPPKTKKPYDLTEELVKRKTDEKQMVKYGEGFFSSLGFAPLPQTFWERSLLKRPQDREVVCYASAWDVETNDDIRIKMCTKITAEDFITVHHELGHNYYQRAYGAQPYLFKNSANDGFHEALGDTIALAITPEYLKKVGLIDRVPGSDSDLDLLLKMALERVAFQPFGLLVDKWRWGVFSGDIKPETYNKAWWDLRKKYQGVKPPTPRTEADFDPGAKYHIPGNTPYARYFLATVLQFQFYRSLCQQSGFKGPLHRCSFYGDKAAGDKLNKMMSMGASRPWPDALEAVTGQRQMDATAILEYFAPLKKWLDEQNKGQVVGWKAE